MSGIESMMKQMQQGGQLPGGMGMQGNIGEVSLRGGVKVEGGKGE